MSAHDPKTNGILNFDELYGRKNLGATTWEIAPPSSLSDCNDNPTTIPRPQLSRDGTTDLSYKFITSPYSVPETFPAYNGGAYSTISTSKPHTRFDLSTLTRDGATIDDVMSVPDLLTHLPYLNNWTNSLQKETVAANILDYADEGLKVTTNHSPGATITSTTYCGNERVPALNEICIGLVNRSTGSGSELYARAELLWLYDTVAPVGMNYEVKFKVNVTATGAGFTNGSYTLTATGLNTTTPASLPASSDQEQYLVSSTARKTFTNTTP